MGFIHFLLFVFLYDHLPAQSADGDPGLLPIKLQRCTHKDSQSSKVTKKQKKNKTTQNLFMEDKKNGGENEKLKWQINQVKEQQCLKWGMGGKGETKRASVMLDESCA